MMRLLLVVAGFAMLALFVLLLLAIGGAVLGLVFGARTLRRFGKARRDRKLRQPPADPLERAWSDAVGEADWATSRIAAARTSCARLIAIAEGDTPPADAVEWADVVRRRVPELVAACIDESRDATPAERRRTLDDLIESLEKIAAEADRRRERCRDQRASRFAVLRTYVDQRTRRDPLN